MKKFIFFLLLVILYSCPAIAGTSDYVEGEVIVVLDAQNASAYSGMGAFSMSAYSQAVSNQAEAFASEFGLETFNTLSEIASLSGKNIIRLRSEYKNTDELIHELSSVEGVLSVSPNYIIKIDPLITQTATKQYQAFNSGRVPNDPLYSKLWGMDNIRVPQVWEHHIGSNSIVVAVLDTGIDYNHTDLYTNMVRDSYGNFGRRFFNGIQSSNPMDSNGHGTHVAGIIGAVGSNGIGIVGVTWRVGLLAVNAMPEGKGWIYDIIDAIDYLLSEKRKGLNIRVINMSFGYVSRPDLDNTPMETALRLLSNAGIICVMSAGNSNLNLNTSFNKPYPACFKFDNTITVGAIDSNNKRSIWPDSEGSNYGNQWVDIAAPGSNIYSTIRNNSFDFKDGTSMATPHVAGAAALLCSVYPNETAQQIKARILSRAKNIGVAEGHWKSGTLDVFSAYGVPDIITSALPNGAIRIAYNQTLGAVGNVPITWSFNNGSLPPGLSLNATTGVITGTPTTAGTFNFTVSATNRLGTATRALRIIITATPVAPIISTASLPGGLYRSSYSHTLSASGTVPITWSIASGKLPTGLILNASNGTISGIPTTQGTFNFTIKATNNIGSTTRALSIVIVAAPIIRTTTLPNAAFGKPYSQTLVVSGTTPITWEWILPENQEWTFAGSGELQTGLNFNRKTGVISGTPIVGGKLDLTVIASNIGGYDFKKLSIYFDPLFSGKGRGLPHDPYIITTPGQLDEVRKDLTAHYRLGNNIDLTAYLASGGAGFSKWGAAGWLPIGTITPPFSGRFNGNGYKITGLWINRSNESFVGLFRQTYEATIENLGVEIASSGIKGYSDVGGLAGRQNIGNITNCHTTGNVSGNANVGGLVGLQNAGRITNSYNKGSVSGYDYIGGLVGRHISGTITNSYTKSNVTATNRFAGGILGYQQGGTIANSYATGNVNSSMYAGGLLGYQYLGEISYSYATGNVTGLYIGGLVGFQSSNSVIKKSYAAGNVIGNYAGGLVGSQLVGNIEIINSYRYQLATINGSIRTENTPNGIHGGIKTAADLMTKSTYTGNSWLFNDTSPAGPWRWDSRGFPKLNIGTEDYPFPFTATTPPIITTTTLPGGTVGKIYSHTLAATGTTPITWSITSGRLPTGLGMSVSTGTISGTPSVVGTFSFTVRATNSAGFSTKDLKIDITAAPTIYTSSLPVGNVGKVYSQTLAVTGSTPMTWSITSGKLPTGLSLNASTGAITGTPTAMGTFSFTVRATNSVGYGTKNLSITVTQGINPYLSTKHKGCDLSASHTQYVGADDSVRLFCFSKHSKNL